MEPDTTIRSRKGPVVMSRGQSMRRRLVLLLSSVALNAKTGRGQQRGGHLHLHLHLVAGRQWAPDGGAS